MDAPSAQLALGIRDAVVRSLATRRPILHHLNADTSWLLQVPRPLVAIKRGTRIYYNILIDPWLSGGQSDVARWFSQQWHASESAVKSVAEVEELAREIEILAGELRLGKSRLSIGDAGADISTFIDAVAISHEFTDHCHKETLLEIGKDIPVFATEKAASLIQSWSHFRTIQTISPFTSSFPDWRAIALPPLPEWLSISRLIAPKDPLYYHSALLIAFNTHPIPTGSSTCDAAEAVIYTPHGIHVSALEPVAVADPPLHTLAFLHGLHAVSIGSAQQLNLGARYGLEAQRALRARYWFGTHDEVKKGGGLVNWFLNRNVMTVEEAVEEERKRRRETGEDGYGDTNIWNGEEWEDVKFEEIPNGESRILE
ncbi:hypothetical protein K432DRAFT_357042 [Lepidopterella palustris CBS 459.81]|uniref:Uncharacterized protein n=1 Tax=Lepidopterella palustris CBS 459.81 TaxID=1314670 RepID=A0A8E2E6Y0_9PEZI|nr:hypothetical protein K432DRAFT_357042 [Lepidopterella palustris CBS 459.81]